jgi:ABC-type molybdate transport system substrate-binding protein
MNVVHKLVAIVLLIMAMSAGSRADDLVLYGAGSLREAMAHIATSFGQAHGVTVATQFGPSGRMRESLRREHVDISLRADVSHARN